MNLNVKAYELHQQGLSYEEIGRELGYNKYWVPTVIEKAFQKQPLATIYRKQVDYCKKICTDSTSECYNCHLYKFMKAKMLKAR